MTLGSAMYIWIATLSEQLNMDGQLPDLTWVFVIAGIWNLLLLIVTVIAIVDGTRSLRAGKTRQLATDGMVVKLISIPFFISNFLVLAEVFVTGGITLIVLIGFALWVVVAVGIGLTYLTMLSTSIYLWAAIARLRRERVISTGLTVLYVILSLLFVTDIAATVLVFGHSRRRPRLALAVLLLSTGGVFVAVGVWTLVGLFEDGTGFGWSLASFYLQWVIPMGIGSVMILATVVVCAVKRAALKLEAQQAAARRTPKEVDAPDSVLAG
jgi:hypothetical protein